MVDISGVISFRGTDIKSRQTDAPEPNVHTAPKCRGRYFLRPSLDKDVYCPSKSNLTSGGVLSKKEKQALEHQKQLESETKGMKFKMIKLKFYPEDEAKLEAMTSTREKIEYIRKLKDEDRYTVVNPEVLREE